DGPPPEQRGSPRARLPTDRGAGRADVLRGSSPASCAHRPTAAPTSEVARLGPTRRQTQVGPRAARTIPQGDPPRTVPFLRWRQRPTDLGAHRPPGGPP